MSASPRQAIPCIGVVCFIAGLLAAGCTQDEWRRFWTRDKGTQPEPDPQLASKSLAIRGTVAPLVTIQGMRMNQVKGFALVLDLVDTGGQDGPEIVRKHLAKEILRQENIAQGNAAPQDILNDRDTVMVEVTGFIPAAARKGDRFDVTIRALGREAESLVGGRLELADLRIYAETPSGVLGGETLALAKGPVFVSPFNRRGKPTDKVNLRKGVVFGGGIVRNPRKLRLVLNTPSPSDAKRIEVRLNGRYGHGDPVAVVRDSASLDLEIPPEYHHRKRFFLERVLHTTLSFDATFLERRTRDLIRELRNPQSDGNSVGLALEAIGNTVLSDLRRLYGNPSGAVAYYAARTGLRLEDRESVEPLARFARDTDSEFRRQAIDELGWAVRMYPAGEHLRKLLGDEDQAIRIEAYKALRRRPHPAIQSKILDKDNVILDVIECKGPFLIYVQRTTAPLIAVFGRNMRCKPPAMFPGTRRDGRRLLTQLSANVGDSHLTFKFINKHNGKISPDLEAPLNVAELIEFLGGAPNDEVDGARRGFAVPYSEIVDILSAYCETGAIGAEFVLEGLEGEKGAEGDEREESEF